MSAPRNAPPPRPWAAKLAAPFAVLGLRTDGRALTGLAYLSRDETALAPADRVAEQAAREIERWLDYPGFRFTVATAPAGTPFRRRVWAALAAIPPGEVRTYGEVARALATAARAVGQACGDNPIPLVIPCHRVVAAGGALGGFMHADGGDALAIKRWLLAHEGARPFA